MSLLAGDLSQLMLPRDLEILRDTARSAADAGDDLGPLYVALAEADTVALIDLVMGPKAVTGAPALAAAFGVLDVLEKASSPSALYRRLADLAEEPLGVLSTAAQRHPGAGWLLALAEKIEDEPGHTQLAAAADHPAFSSVCAAYAGRGHTAALVAMASRGRPEPVGHLAAAGHDAEAVEAAAHALAHDPECPVTAWIAAARGPQADALLRKLLTRLRTRAAIQAVQEDLAPFPHTQRLYALVRAGTRA